MDEKERIRNAYYLQEKSIREIAREMRHSRKTVRKALSDPSPPVYTRCEPVSSPVVDPVKEIIDNWIEEDETRPRKQRHTAHRIYERLRDERGSAVANLNGTFYSMTNSEQCFYVKIIVAEDGVMDNAGNPYDADPSTPEIESSAKYKLKIDKDGNVSVLEETYE